MGDDSNIEWTDATWNPVRGCSRVSPGCDNCYAMRQARRSHGPGGAYEGLTTIRRGKVDWVGRTRFVREMLGRPLRWKRPRRIFVNSMSDLFHESVSDAEIAATFGVMAASERHTFQILTKRAARMREWFKRDVDHATECGEAAEKILGGSSYFYGAAGAWPLPNVWLGVSCEDQDHADKRIPGLLESPAAVRFVSAEPLLGRLDLTPYMHDSTCPLGDGGAKYGQGARNVCLCTEPRETGLDWVIVGGESGPGARPFHVDWVRAIVRDCRVAGVPVFVKQFGANVRDRNDVGFEGDDGDAWDLGPRLFDAVEHDPDGVRDDYQGAPVRVVLKNGKGGDPEEWPKKLRVREFPREAT